MKKTEENVHFMLILIGLVLVLYGVTTISTKSGIEGQTKISTYEEFAYTNSTLLALIQGNQSCKFFFVGSPIAEEIDYTNNGFSDHLVFTQAINVSYPGIVSINDCLLYSITYFNDSDTYYEQATPCGDTIVHFIPSKGVFNLSLAIDGETINSNSFYNSITEQNETYLYVNFSCNFKITTILFNGSTAWQGAAQSINSTYTVLNPDQWDSFYPGVELISPIRNILRQESGFTQNIGGTYSWQKRNIGANWYENITQSILTNNQTFLMVSETKNDNGTLQSPQERPVGFGFDDMFYSSLIIPTTISSDLLFAYMIEKALWSLSYAGMFNCSFDFTFYQISDFLFANFTAANNFQYEGTDYEWNNTFNLVYSVSEGILVQNSFEISLWGAELHIDLLSPQLEIPTSETTTTEPPTTTTEPPVTTTTDPPITTTTEPPITTTTEPPITTTTEPPITTTTEPPVTTTTEESTTSITEPPITTTTELPTTTTTEAPTQTPGFTLLFGLSMIILIVLVKSRQVH
ncbi:MAG: hypothetical protein JSV04_11975 [Candidatus Heimdallarchaeota archaeon]|nr:MAG: hypothetical protein JSV04_11975 [Candidatus Heimdallarchaeota archaeon]